MSSLLPPTARNTLGVGPAGRAVVALAHGWRGAWAYRAFDWVNAEYFAGALPTPLFQLAITAFGHCLGLTRVAGDLLRPPVVTLHTSLWGASATAIAARRLKQMQKAHRRNEPLEFLLDKVWGFPVQELGSRYALDVLLHECIHVHIEYVLGGRTGGESSHNNPEWIAEVNRLAPMLGLVNVRAAMSKVKRVGKKTMRVSEGSIPFFAVASFPEGVRRFRETAATYYRDRAPLSFERDAQLDVTP